MKAYGKVDNFGRTPIIHQVFGKMNARKLILTSLLFVVYLKAISQWSPDPYQNNPVCTFSRDQEKPKTLSDSHGGVYVFWNDHRFNGVNVVMGQHIDGSGTSRWTSNGQTIQISYELWDVFPCDSASTILLFIHLDDIYAQKVGSNGDTLFGTFGSKISNTSQNRSILEYRAISDNEGGAYVTWHDVGQGNRNVWVGRIYRNGGTWATQLPDLSSTEGNPHISLRDSGGVYIAWQDQFSSPSDLYFARVDSNGSLPWGSNGRGFGPSSSITGLLSDGDNGAIIFHEYGNPQTPDSRMLRVRDTASIVPGWTAVGRPVNPSNTALISVKRSGNSYLGIFAHTNSSLFIHKIDTAASFVWPQMETLYVAPASPSILNWYVDDEQRVALLIEDQRLGVAENIYLQLLDSTGRVRTSANDVPVALSQWDDRLYGDFTYLGNDCYAIAWEDYRPGSHTDIYASKLCSGSLLLVSSIGMTGDSVLCPGDTAVLSVANQNNLSYQWYRDSVAVGIDTNFLQITASGTYFVVASSANDTVISDSVIITVNQPQSPQILNLGSSYCENDTAVSLIGNPMGGQFSGAADSIGVFSPMLLGNGIHFVTYSVVDSFGCTSDTTVGVTIHLAPQPVIYGLDSIYCLGPQCDTFSTNSPSVVVTGSGVTGSCFLPSSAGVGVHLLSAIETDTNGCIGYSDTSIRVINEASALFSFNVVGTVANFTNQASGYDSLIWDFGNGNFSNAVNPWHDFLINDTFWVCLTATNSACSAIFCDTVITGSTVDHSSRWESELVCYPQPATNQLMIEFPRSFGRISSLVVYDMNGAVHPSRFRSEKQTVHLFLGRLAKGTYFFEAKGGNGAIRKRFVVM